MITAQDIREKTFTKAKIGGYDMEEIDEFLELVADDLTAAQKESAVLKSKMKVLVDKIEEYRSNESALNQAVLSAQKLAVQIENDAKERAEKLISEAEETRKEKLSGITSEVDAEKKRLEDAKIESAKFLDGIKAMYKVHLKNIESITGDEDFAKIEKTIAPTVNEVAKKEEKKAVEDTVRLFEQPVIDVDAAVKEIEKNISNIEPHPETKMDLSDDFKDIPFLKRKAEDSTQPFTL